MKDNANKAELRIAVMSDPHIGFIGHINPNYYGLGQQGDQDKWVEYALRWFKEKGIDVLVVPGDMANACAYSDPNLTHEDYAMSEMIRFGGIFRKVFEGTDTELVCIYGNHDSIVQNRERLNGGDGSPWGEAFGEIYSHTVVKRIKGYSFVGAHWGYEKEAKNFVKEEVLRSPDKPVFYLQHGDLKGTTCDSYLPSLSGGVGIENVQDFENVIAMFGHTHCPITDERTIWQSADSNAPKCTVISCGSFNYADSTGDLVRGENLQTKHALYLTVKGKKINVERLSFWTDEMLALAKGEKFSQDMEKCTRSAGQDWRFVLGGEKVMDINKRAEKARAPEFPEGATAGLARNDKFVVVFFPSAIPPDGADILHSYYVEAYEAETDELVSTGQISAEFHIDGSNEHFSPYYQVVVWNLKPNTEYVFKIYARDCFQKKSLRPIIYRGRTLTKDIGRLK